MSMEAPMLGRRPRNPAGVIVELMMAEVHANASPDEVRALLNVIGRHLATCFPLSGAGDLATLEGDLNAVFDEIGLGSARLTLTPDAVLIDHEVADADEAGDSQGWRIALPTILQGAYDGWLRELGSSGDLQTKLVSADATRFTFRHGR